MLADSTRRQFLKFCNERQIGRGSDVDLITADYRGREAAAVRDSCAALLEQHHPGNLARYAVRSILQSMLSDPAAVIPGVRKLARLRNSGNEDIPIEFIGFDSELDGVPSPEQYRLWEPTFLAESLARTEPYVRLIQQSCAELLRSLQTRYPDDL